MKEGFSQQEQEHIRRAKQILRHLWDKSGVKGADALSHLEGHGQLVKKSTFSMWMSTQEGNFTRPKKEAIEPLVRLFCGEVHSADQVQEILDEVNLLLGYAEGPKTSEMIQNQVARQLNENLSSTLRRNQEKLSEHLSSLDWLLDEIEDKILEYDKGYPVLHIQAEDRKLLRQLLGADRKRHDQFRVEDGFEIPLTQIQSLEVIAGILNNLNEGARLLRAYIERHLLDEDGLLSMDFPRVEDFVAYTWEISDRLLNNNTLCKAVPVMKRTLLRVMTTCWGIRYILGNQDRELSEVQFQNVLQLKGKTSRADINCSVAVYMGVLARQLIRSQLPDRVRKGLSLYEKAARMLERDHGQLNTEQEVFYYKKELANLCYDAGAYMLPLVAKLPDCRDRFLPAMKKAHQYYAEVLTNLNLFLLGLTEQRANHLRIFHTISLCWVTGRLEEGVGEINRLSASDVLNENFWLVHVGKAIAYGVLCHRAGAEGQQFKEAALASLHRAMLVPGFDEKTRQELEADFVLQQLFPAGLPARAF